MTLWGRVHASNVLTQQSNTNKKHSATVRDACYRLRLVGRCAHIKNYTTTTTKLATHKITTGM